MGCSLESFHVKFFIAVQAHRAAGVVVMLRVRAGLRVGADDRQAMRRRTSRPRIRVMR